MKREWLARLFLLMLIAGTPLVLLRAFWAGPNSGVLIHASRPEVGGWMPASLSAQAGKPLQLLLTADDMMHGFAIGRTDLPAVDVRPGQITEVTVTFDEPGTYTYYCTRWCGPNHWRMRGTITVSGEGPQLVEPVIRPAYVTLQMNIDDQLPAIEPNLTRPPSAKLVAADVQKISTDYLTAGTTTAQSPYQVWQQLRNESELVDWDYMNIWDAVAYLWHRETTAATLETGALLYAANCAACHGITGAGDGVFAELQATAVPDFTNPAYLLNLSSARLEGKIVRGGMGTGMPNWGTIFTGEETQALVDYLWSLQFPAEKPGK